MKNISFKSYLVKLGCYLFNSGYNTGHHDTVEGTFGGVHYSDMYNYHDDNVDEIVDDIIIERCITNYGDIIDLIQNPSEQIQLAVLENVWTEKFYEDRIKKLPNKTEWFYRELNRLKLIKGPLKQNGRY